MRACVSSPGRLPSREAAVHSLSLHVGFPGTQEQNGDEPTHEPCTGTQQQQLSWEDGQKGASVDRGLSTLSTVGARLSRSGAA